MLVKEEKERRNFIDLIPKQMLTITEIRLYILVQLEEKVVITN